MKLATDEDLALGIQRGQTGDLVTLVERHYSILMGYLYRMTGGNRMLSEDMAQETFLRVLKGIGGYQYPRPFKPWLYAIAANLTRNFFKQADTRHTISAEDEAYGETHNDLDSPEGSLLASDEAQQVVGALKLLPTHQREVVILRYYQELSLGEIAEILDIPVGTVKSRLSLGLRRLREAMEVQNQ
jgi:RNA polymerase sigma-70 factor (ECF subfamily)